MLLSLIVIGAIKMWMRKYENERRNRLITGISMGISVLIVLFLAMAREAYAVTVVFLLLIIKGFLLLKYIKAGG